MTKIKLTAKQETQLNELIKQEKRAKVQRRLLFIKMKNEGMTNRKIASIVQVCPDTLTDWNNIFNEFGFEGVSNFNYDDRRESKLKKFNKEIKKQIDEGKINTLSELQNWLKENHKIYSCISNLFYHCKKNSIYLTKKQD